MNFRLPVSVGILQSALLLVVLTEVNTSQKRPINKRQSPFIFPDTTTKYESFGRMVLANPDQSNIQTLPYGCSGFFVTVSNVDAQKNQLGSTSFFVSDANCLNTVALDSLKCLSKSDGQRQLNSFRNGTAYVYVGVASKQGETALKQNLSKSPIRVPLIYTPSQNAKSCPAIGDISIMELSTEVSKQIEGAGGKFLPFKSVDSGVGLAGETCWIVGIGSDPIQMFNVTFYNDNCLKSCSTSEREWWACMRYQNPTDKPVPITLKKGDIGGPIWCLRACRNGGTRWRIEGILRSLNEDQTMVVTKAMNIRDMLIEAFKRSVEPKLRVLTSLLKL